MNKAQRTKYLDDWLYSMLKYSGAITEEQKEKAKEAFIKKATGQNFLDPKKAPDQ